MGPASTESGTTGRVAEEGPSRDNVLKAAKRVFAEQGFDGATVKDICDLAGVNISAVSYYFGGKEELYRICLEQFGRDRLALAERVLRSAESYEDLRLRLKLFTEEFIACHFADLDVATILHRDCVSNRPVNKQVFKEVFIKIFETIVSFFKAAKSSKILKVDFDPELTASSYFGALIHLLRVDRIGEEHFGHTLKDEKHRKRFVNHHVNLILQGVRGGAE